MLNRVHIDRRVLIGFMILMLVTNAMILFAHWDQIRAGKNDFPNFYSNAQMVREGRAAEFADFAVHNSFVRRVSDLPREPFNHLPYELLIFVPLTYFQFATAYILWTLVGLGMLAGVALLMRNFRLGSTGFSLTFLTVLAFFPVWYCVLMGQDSILLLLLFAFSLRFWKRGKEDAAGFVLALGLFRPQLVLPFVLVAFLGGKWKFVRGFIPGAVLVVALSTWVVGFHGMVDYARILVAQGTEGSPSALAEQWHVQPEKMATWRGFLSVCLPEWIPIGFRSFLVLLGTFTGLLWAAKRMRSVRDEETFDLAFALAVAVVTLVSFHSFLYDFSLMILPVLIAGAVVVSSVRVPEKNAYLALTFGFLFFLTPLYFELRRTDKIGLFFLPASAAIWLMSRWRNGSSPVAAGDQHSAEPISLRTV
jgi:hypothetical protein